VHIVMQCMRDVSEVCCVCVNSFWRGVQNEYVHRAAVAEHVRGSSEISEVMLVRGLLWTWVWDTEVVLQLCVCLSACESMFADSSQRVFLCRVCVCACVCDFVSACVSQCVCANV